MRLRHHCAQAQVAQLELAEIAIDENVVALDVAVNDGVFKVGMLVVECLENLSRPPSHCFHIDLSCFHELLKVSRRHELGDEDHMLIILTLPPIGEFDDVPVVQFTKLQNFIAELFILLPVQITPVDLIPCYGLGIYCVKGLVNCLERAFTQRLF